MNTQNGRQFRAAFQDRLYPSKEYHEHIFVYILRLDGKHFYTGMSSRLEVRMREHRDGRSKSTRKYEKKEAVWLMEFEDRKEARALEVRIKSRGAARFMKTYSSGNHGEIMISYLCKILDGRVQ